MGSSTSDTELIAGHLRRAVVALCAALLFAAFIIGNGQPSGRSALARAPLSVGGASVVRGVAGGSPTPTTIPAASDTPIGPTAQATNTNTRTPPPSLTPTPTATTVLGCNPMWFNTDSPTTLQLNSVSAASIDYAWAVGNGGIFRLQGNIWAPMSLPLPPFAQSVSLNAVAVGFYALGEAWAAGSYIDIAGNQQAVVYHWDGTSWSVVPGTASRTSPSGGTLNYLYDIYTIGDQAAFAVGRSVSNGDVLIYRCGPRSCVPSSHPVVDAALNGVWGVWAVGNVIMHFNGTDWSIASAPDVGILRSVWGWTNTNVWAVGDNGVIHWDGSTWSQVPGPTGMRSIRGQYWMGPNDVWAVGDTIWHWNGYTWTQVSSPATGLNSVSGKVSGGVWGALWAVGRNGVILEYGAQPFSDVRPSSPFFARLPSLACRALIAGYPCGGPGEPCDSQHRPYFRPNNNLTRGQLSKIVSNAAGFADPQTMQMFQDVPPGSAFFVYIGRFASRGYIGGYACGGPGEPCVPPNNLPYFRPNNNATRGQIAKIVENAAGLDPCCPNWQTYEDVPIGSTYYEFIEDLTSYGVMRGYECGGPDEPCVPPDNRPYFRPNSYATRGQTSKIVGGIFFP